jgi:DNA-binding CsgD family transcriptional regulator
MDVIGTDRGFARSWDATVSVVRLCHALGRPSFSERVSETIASFIDVDHFSAFATAPSGPPRILATGSRNNGSLSSDIAKTYIARFSAVDPVWSILNRQSPPPATFACRIRSDEVQDAHYRRLCYDDPKIAERLTVGSREGGQWLSLNLYRLRGVAPFDAHDLARAMRAAACILPLLPEHAEREPLAVRGPRHALSEFAERLKQHPCRLTGREVEVCARSLIGMTAEATALDLGIGVTSVATYRKRAYQRLGITSQAELFAILPDRP